MQRRNFLKLSGLSVGSVAAGGSLIGLLTGCRKDHHRGLKTEPVWVKEGDFSRLLSFPSTAGANHTITAQVTSTNLNG